MSGAGRGVTPGAEPEAGSGESAASPEPDQAPSASADDGAEASGPAEASGAAGAGADVTDAPPDDKAASRGSRPASRRPRRKRSFWREFPILVVIALLLAVVIKTYAIQAFFIPSGSMENSLEINDRVLVNKLVYDVRDIHRGDIVVFNGDGSWDPGTVPTDTNFLVKFADGFASMFGFGHPGDILIKRVIGLPGDQVACCDAQGRVTVNGVPLTEPSYLYPGDAPSEIRFNIIVPPGRLWVMGDHRLISDDSRNHLGEPGGGTVPESAVVGRAFVIIWPPSRWRFLPIPGTFEQPKLNAAAAAAGTPAAQDTADLLSARLEPSSPALPLASASPRPSRLPGCSGGYGCGSAAAVPPASATRGPDPTLGTARPLHRNAAPSPSTRPDPLPPGRTPCHPAGPPVGCQVRSAAIVGLSAPPRQLGVPFAVS